MPSRHANFPLETHYKLAVLVKSFPGCIILIIHPLLQRIATLRSAGLLSNFPSITAARPLRYYTHIISRWFPLNNISINWTWPSARNQTRGKLNTIKLVLQFIMVMCRIATEHEVRVQRRGIECGIWEIIYLNNLITSSSNWNQWIWLLEARVKTLQC